MNENISSLLVEQTIISCACLLAFLHAADSPHTFSPDEALFLRAFYNVAVVIRHQALHVSSYVMLPLLSLGVAGECVKKVRIKHPCVDVVRSSK
ncbi:unnamed protein product [Onchocerca flexuosa]|uniref:Secreted protein n=1 Tax=Onchocerca flexuosa TaxID=387005 RepID=A0A183H1J4_9BILA|nr:unnamed protein product [Onchocerca flexuosa]